MSTHRILVLAGDTPGEPTRLQVSSTTHTAGTAAGAGARRSFTWDEGPEMAYHQVSGCRPAVADRVSHAHRSGMTNVEEVDLAALAETLKRFFETDRPVGYLRGRTAFRDAVVERLGCSQLEAEELVDTMELQGFLHFDGDPSRRSEASSGWDFDSQSLEPEE